MTHEEWVAEGERRFGTDARKWKFVCPMCGTAQSAEDFYAEGFARDNGQVNGVLGFSCIGRWRMAGPHQTKNPPGRGCDWTLGGLFQIHTLEVEMVKDDGTVTKRPTFEFAAPGVAQNAATEAQTSTRTQEARV